MKTAEQFKAEVVAALRVEQTLCEESAKDAEKADLVDAVNSYWDQFNEAGRCIEIVEATPTDQETAVSVVKLIKLLRHDADLAAPIGVLVNDKFTEVKAIRITTEGVLLLTEKWIYARVLPARNGRFAVFARIQPDHEWVQVEAVTQAELADAMAEGLEYDEEQRAEEVASDIGTFWGDDAPAAPPQK